MSCASTRSNADIAVAVSGHGENRRTHPVFCVLKTTLLDHLNAYLHDGGRKVSAWQAQHKLIEVVFEDENAFRNVNTLDDLRICEALSA